MKSFLREPLVHFLLLGACLFLLYGFFDDQNNNSTNKVVITDGEIQTLQANFARKWQRQPTEKELKSLLDEHILTEIYYREAVALGLDQDDLIIRRRLKQKLELLSKNLAEDPVPTDEELEQFLQDHPELFKRDPQLSFRQIYFNVDQRGTAATEAAKKLLERLQSDPSFADSGTLGDEVMLPRDFKRIDTRDISRLFGTQFSREIMQIEPGSWAGPIRSGYGLHLVLVSQKIGEELPELAEVRADAKQEWLNMKRKEFKETLDQTLLEKYEIVYKLSGTEN